jgi:ribosomal protein S18 acetylase RimI-like enzyme
MRTRLVQHLQVSEDNMELRLLNQHDAAAWWHLRLEALEDAPASFADSVEDHRRTTIESTRARLESSSPHENFIVGMFGEGKLAGVAGFYRHERGHFRHKGHIWGVYVTPGSRRKGVARSLMGEIIRRARAISGIEQINLVVSAPQISARQLYSSLGFRTFGIERRSLKIGDNYIDDELMTLFLGSASSE